MMKYRQIASQPRSFKMVISHLQTMQMKGRLRYAEMLMELEFNQRRYAAIDWVINNQSWLKNYPKLQKDILKFLKLYYRAEKDKMAQIAEQKELTKR